MTFWVGLCRGAWPLICCLALCGCFPATQSQLDEEKEPNFLEGKSRVKIHVPLIEMTKAQIIRKGVELGINYGLTWSCYDPAPEGRACGLCDSCQLRLKGFKEAGLDDPLAYVGF